MIANAVMHLMRLTKPMGLSVMRLKLGTRYACPQIGGRL